MPKYDRPELRAGDDVAVIGPDFVYHAHGGFTRRSLMAHLLCRHSLDLVGNVRVISKLFRPPVPISFRWCRSEGVFYCPNANWGCLVDRSKLGLVKIDMARGEVCDG
jgi:hypothetical protein